MPHRGDHHRGQGCESQPPHQGRHHGHGDPETTHTLQEGSEDPANDDGLHAFVSGQVGQSPPDGFDRAGLISDAEQQEGHPDDEKHVDRQQQGFAVRHSQQLRAGTKSGRGNHQRRQIANRASA